jgi:hypothetical protein
MCAFGWRCGSVPGVTVTEAEAGESSEFRVAMTVLDRWREVGPA